MWCLIQGEAVLSDLALQKMHVMILFKTILKLVYQLLVQNPISKVYWMIKRNHPWNEHQVSGYL